MGLNLLGHDMNTPLSSSFLVRKRLIVATLFSLMAIVPAILADTVITNSRAEIAFMAGLWESDTIQISPLANAQYPSCTGTWQFIYPLRVESDGDVHIRTGVNSAGGCTGANNINNSPIINEVVNVFNTANPIWTHLVSLGSGRQAKPTGIFRFYTEHTSDGTSSGVGERHFEIHPMTQLYVWNASSNAFLLDSDYHSSITNVSDGTTHSSTTLRQLFDGTQQTTNIVMSDNNRVISIYPSPSVNYVQYDAFVKSALTNDSVSSYIMIQPFNPSLSVLVRCRLITNTLAATVASVLVSNQSITLNALSRTDLLVVSNQIASMTAGQTNGYTRPVELITLGILTASPTISSVNPGCGGIAGGTPITITGNNFIPGSTVTIGGVAATSVVFSNVNILTAITPPGAAGPQTVAVKSPSSSVPGTRANGFIYATPVSFGGVSNVAPAIEAATLTWSAATGTGVTYQVFEGTGSGLENFGSAVATTTNLSALVTPLYPGSNAPISYYFVVRASDVCGNSESNVVEQSVQPLLDPNKDQDADGMPNWFEQLYGLNPFDSTDASVDSDGDGFTNLQEYLAGTNPLDPMSRFRILSVVADPSGDIVTWSASSNKIYQLQLDLDLASATWSNVGPTVTDDVGQLTLSETNLVDVSILNRFYRVLLSQ